MLFVASGEDVGDSLSPKESVVLTKLHKDELRLNERESAAVVKHGLGKHQVFAVGDQFSWS